MSWMDNNTDDWITASLYDTRSEYKRMRRLAQKTGAADGIGVHYIRITSVGDAAKIQRAADTKAMEAFNKKVEEWQRITVGSLRANLLRMGIGKGELYDSIKPTAKKNEYGEIEIIGFSFARQGIFIHKGAYRGFGGYKGSKWSYRKSTKFGYIYTNEMRSTAPESRNRLAFSRMKDRNWFNPVISKRIDRLAEICTAYCDELIIDASKILIEN